VSEERWLMVSDGTPQMLYLGKSRLTDEEIEKVSQEGRFLVLEECRTLRALMIPSPEGVILQNQLTPAGMCRGAAKIRVKPSSYLRPDEDSATMKPVQAQLELCEAAELKHRAKEAGLVTADGVRVGPNGRLT